LTSTPLNHFPADARSLLTVKGIDLVEKLGIDAVREVVVSVLSGENLRQATETLTRRRIALLNAALLVLFIRGSHEGDAFTARLPESAYAALQEKGLSTDDRRVLLWLLGLTKKQVENVLRSDADAWHSHVEEFSADLAVASAEAQDLYGLLSGTAELSHTEHSADLSWPWALHLLSTVGSQTLATRGSEKSMYGKFFEKLILGGALHVLGLRLVEVDDISAHNVFWLSSQGRKRESDATALFGKGVGIRFDIGFIGPGNPEISLDKVSRFEREIEIGGESVYMHTFIIVDRIAKKSRIVELAADIEGTIIQMSAKYWPAELAEKLAATVDDFESPFNGLDDTGIHAVIERRIADAPFEQMLRIAIDDEGTEDVDIENSADMT
jgi:hypothetical protein